MSSGGFQTQKVLHNKSVPIGEVVLTVKVGIESVAKDRWRVWYCPILNAGTNVTYVTAPPGGLSEERAKQLAATIVVMLNTNVRVCIEQITDDAGVAIAQQQLEESERTKIDRALGN